MNNTKNINYPLLILGLLQVLFIIVAAISIKNMMQDEKINPDDTSRQSSISIERLSSKIPEISSDSKDEIQRELLRIVKNNTTDVDFGSVEAIIRDESIHANFFETENLGEVNFIVDIPELSQTYQLFYEYSPDLNNSYLEKNDRIIALCVEPSEVKYQDFNCNGFYTQGTRNFLVQKYLEFADFENFYAEILDEDYSVVRVCPFYHNETDGDLFIEETKEMIRSFGVSPDLFTYQIVQPKISVPHSH